MPNDILHVSGVNSNVKPSKTVLSSIQWELNGRKIYDTCQIKRLIIKTCIPVEPCLR